MKLWNLLVLFACVTILSACSTQQATTSASSALFHVQYSRENVLDKITSELHVKSATAIEHVAPTIDVKYNATTDLKSLRAEIVALTEKATSESGKRKLVKQYIKEHKTEIKNAVMVASATNELPQISQNSKADEPPFIERPWAALLGFLIPPVGAGLYFGKDKRTWITLGLTLLFWLPGAIYALIMILRD